MQYEALSHLQNITFHITECIIFQTKELLFKCGHCQKLQKKKNCEKKVKEQNIF